MNGTWSFDRTFIYRIEKGETTPSLDTVLKIASALGVPIDELIVDSATTTNSLRDTDADYLLLDCTDKETPSLVEVLAPLTDTDRDKVFVIDDTAYERRCSQHVEFQARLFDHARQRLSILCVEHHLNTIEYQ